MVLKPHGRRVTIYTIIIFVLIFTCFENNKDKIINKILTKNTPHCTIYIFLAGAAPEFNNHVIPYHYFHIKNEHFGNY